MKYIEQLVLSDEDLVHGLLRVYAKVNREDKRELSRFRKYAIQVYQTELRQLLVYLLQHRSGIFRQRNHLDELNDRVKALADLAHCVDKSVDDKHPLSLATTKFSAGRSSYQELSVFISEGYQLLEESFFPLVCDETERKEVTIPPLRREDYDKDTYLHLVLRLQDYVRREMKPFLRDFLLHGSLATLDYEPGFSDFDTLMILNRSILFEPKALLALRDKVQHSLGYLYAVDPLQHHGYIVTSEVDLKYYPPPVMPLEVLGYSKSLLGGNDASHLEINVCDAEIDRKTAFWRQYLAFKRLHEGEATITSLYDMKFFVSRLLIMPTLYLQLMGIQRYKKHSFSEASKQFPPEVWRIVEKASGIRKEWPQKEGYPSFWYRMALSTTRFYPPSLGLIRYYYQKAKAKVPQWMFSRLGENYIEEAYSLVQQMVYQAKQAGKL